jgi:hypothetical protein
MVTPNSPLARTIPVNSPSELADRLVELFPSFAPELENEATESYHQVIQRLTPVITGYLAESSDHVLRQFCDLVNSLADSGGEKENAIATCLLEHASQVKLRKLISPYLTGAARKELR